MTSIMLKLLRVVAFCYEFVGPMDLEYEKDELDSDISVTLRPIF